MQTPNFPINQSQFHYSFTHYSHYNPLNYIHYTTTVAKLVILLASFASLLLLINASTLRTTVILDEEDIPSNARRGGSCMEQCMNMQYMRHCQRYTSQQCCGGYGDNQQQQMREMCCNQIRQMRDEQCRCECLRMGIEHMSQMQEIRGQMREAFEFAENLPSMCGVGPDVCQLESRRI